ncbi:unnamed protein product, partial [Discosporangium mesarthrocarpum]
TEICRNWQKGTCPYGAKCAFAHGTTELKHQTLDEMEHSGRIPNASKFRCYPCLTWVATGSCPYFSRCVFIHDTRIRGACEAWLYAGSTPKTTGLSPFGRDTFYWPDMERDPDDTRVRYDVGGGGPPSSTTWPNSLIFPSISANYEIKPELLDSPDPTDRWV